MQPNGQPEKTVRFGSFEMKPASGELFRDKRPVKLPPQPFKVLALLVGNAGQLVTREEIKQQVWGNGTFVDFDKGLNFAIKQVREALGDNAQSPIYIETLPRRGYRFIAAVEDHVENVAEITTAQETVGASTTQSTDLDKLAQVSLSSLQQAESNAEQSFDAPRLIKRRAAVIALASLLIVALYFAWKYFSSPVARPAAKVMLVVLPFENLNNEPEQDYFSDGLTEEMITQLGRLQPERLGVIARTTALKYKNTDKDVRQIGRELGASYVLEGSVRRERDRLRITVQLIQVSDQANLWSETFERSTSDVIQIQSEVARSVARSLALELLPAPHSDSIAARTANPEAYDSYLKGRFLITKDTVPDLERSLPYFDKAIALDPEFAPAYVGAVEARALLATFQNTPAMEILQVTKAAAAKALALNSSLAEAHAAMASVNFWLEWNLAEAEANIERAVKLNPSDPNAHLLYASCLLVQGKPEAAASEVKLALQIDPVSLLTNGLAAYFYLRARQFDEAIFYSKRMLELEPNSPAAHECLISAYRFKAMHEEARELMRKRMAQVGAQPQYLEAISKPGAKEAIMSADRLQLDRLLKMESGGGRVSALSIARLYSFLGEKEKAFHYLEKSFTARECMLIFLKVHPAFDHLRSDARFADLVRRMGLAL